MKDYTLKYGKGNVTELYGTPVPKINDVLPSDAGKLKEGPDMELVKKVSAVAGVMLLIVILCVVAMYLL